MSSKAMVTEKAMREAAYAGRAPHSQLERDWEWHLQLMAEVLFSRFRLALIAGAGIWWTFGLHSPLSQNAVAWVVIGASVVYAAVNEAVLRYGLSIGRNFPLGSVIADWVLIGACIWATGGRSSPMQFFMVIGVTSAALRLSLPRAIYTSLAYLALSLSFGDADSLVPDAIMIVVLGVGIGMWADTMRRLHIGAVRDPLTGLYSRGFGMLRLKEAIAEASHPFVVAMIDVDEFKSVNDIYGHAAGDTILRQVAHNMVSALRPDDFLCRIGGDEFMAVFRGVDASTSAALGERIRVAIATTPIGIREENVKLYVTLSIGLTEAHPSDSITDLLKAADAAMYAAKKSKNSVVALRSGSRVRSSLPLDAPRKVDRFATAY